jgi:hypothetical protein
MKFAMHVDGPGWQFDGNDVFAMELWGNHAIIKPVGELYIKFHDGDEYCWSTVGGTLTSSTRISHLSLRFPSDSVKAFSVGVCGHGLGCQCHCVGIVRIVALAMPNPKP